MKIKYVLIISMMVAMLLLVACKPGEKDDVVEESSALAGQAVSWADVKQQEIKLGKEEIKAKKVNSITCPSEIQLEEYRFRTVHGTELGEYILGYEIIPPKENNDVFRNRFSKDHTGNLWSGYGDVTAVFDTKSCSKSENRIICRYQKDEEIISISSECLSAWDAGNMSCLCK